jgi:hypothetical protein
LVAGFVTAVTLARMSDSQIVEVELAVSILGARPLVMGTGKYEKAVEGNVL